MVAALEPGESEKTPAFRVNAQKKQRTDTKMIAASTVA